MGVRPQACTAPGSNMRGSEGDVGWADGRMGSGVTRDELAWTRQLLKHRREENEEVSPGPEPLLT